MLFSFFIRVSNVVAVDKSNVEEIMRAASYWGDDSKQLAKDKTKLMLDFSKDEEKRGKGVPDPYYGGADGFERVLDLLDDASEGLLERIDNTKN